MNGFVNVVIPNARRTAILKTIRVSVPVTIDPHTGEELLTQSAIRKISNIKNHHNEVPHCQICGVTISKATYGRYGDAPTTVWKHVGNRWQTAPKGHKPVPPTPAN